MSATATRKSTKNEKIGIALVVLVFVILFTVFAYLEQGTAESLW